MKTAKFWDKLANNFDESEQQFEQIYSSILQNTKKYLKHQDNVLDFGCATGIKTIAIAGDVEKVTGIDISEKMIEIAGEKAVARKIHNIDFNHVSIHDNSLAKESFNVVLAFNILHLLENNQKIIKRINELLKKDGLFISATPCLKEKKNIFIGIYFFFAHIFAKIGVLPIFLKKFSKHEIEHLLTSNHFEIINNEMIYDKLSNFFVVARK